MKNVPVANKPCEVLCFFPVEVPTQEGDAYVYLTMDVATEFLFQTGSELSNDIDMVVKHIERLLNHKDFNRCKNQAFTLVLHKYEAYQSKIAAIIEPYGGKLVIDEVYIFEKMIPAIETIFRNMAR
ncbi:hypothetical protein SAMN05216464_11087 [Mucilaginibacter pineti]|uniref:Uncharacterized protein n=1 Tax=Mucilaginibacter pineti TaxID=1391627 RepID=A0A1G7GD19_9SPHI|nr:hypothetical protein [Mucilaginibacter pineti]SDE86036.1 hypothetical protein SAMN05216464_11087 [Mucilaginibacter pineti]